LEDVVMDKNWLTETRILRDRLALRKFVVAIGMLMLCAMAIVPSGASARDRRDRDELNEPTANQVIDLADARIARFKADLRLTPDQEKNWGPVQAALHDMAKRRADRILKLRDDRAAATQRSEAKDSKAGDGKAESARSWTAIDEMRAQADATTAHAEDLRKFADVAGPLYDSLDAAQQRRFGGFIAGYFSEARENDWRR
jgi:uncharacterized protein YdaU (DUF1376 family)